MLIDELWRAGDFLAGFRQSSIPLILRVLHLTVCTLDGGTLKGKRDPQVQTLSSLRNMQHMTGG